MDGARFAHALVSPVMSTAGHPHPTPAEMTWKSVSWRVHICLGMGHTRYKLSSVSYFYAFWVPALAKSILSTMRCTEHACP